MIILFSVFQIGTRFRLPYSLKFRAKRLVAMKVKKILPPILFLLGLSRIMFELEIVTDFEKYLDFNSFKCDETGSEIH